MKTLYTTYNNFAKRLAMTMMVLMTIGIGIVWADTYTWTLNSGDLSANSSSVTKGLPQTTWQTTYNWTTSQTYFGSDNQLGRGLQIGSADKSCQKAVFTTNGISGTINSIKINSSGNANATINVTIGGESVISSNLTTSATDYTSGTINKSGTIEITLSNNGESKALYMKSITIEYTPNGSSAPTPEQDPNYAYVATLVTDASKLSVDDQIIIVAKNTDVALSTTQNNNNRGQATVKKENNLVYFNDDAQLITLEEGTVDNTFAFNVGNSYLYAASSSSNHLKTQQTKNDNGSWSISITNEGVATIKAQGTYTHNLVQYNSGNDIFSCYSSNQQSVAIYKYESCTNSVSIEQGTMENVNSMTFSTEGLKTCTNTDAERQVTITITPAECYLVTDDTRLEVTGTTATHVEGPTTEDNVNYTFVYQFAKDATGTSYFSASLDTKMTYTVNYNNGEGDNASDTKICGEDLTLKGAIFTRFGYNQVGWSTTDGGNKEYELGGTYSDDASTTLYPVWEAKPLTNYRTLCTYEILLDKNGGIADGSAFVTATKANLTEIKAPVNAGYQILGYYAEPACTTLIAEAAGALQSNTPYTNAHGGWTAREVTLYPKWEAIEYTITWNVGDDPFKTKTTTVSAINPLVLPTAPANNDLGCCADMFVGWTASTAKVVPTETIFSTTDEAQAKYPSISSDMTFYAVFATAAKGVGTSTVVFSEMGYANGEQVTSVTLGDSEGSGDAIVTFAKAASSSNEAKYYNDGSALRVYAGSTITVTSTYAGAHISKVVLTYADNDAVDDNTITAEPAGLTDNIWTGNASSVEFTIGGSTGHRRIASIAVTTDVDGRSYTNYVTHCETLSNPTLGAETLTYANGTAIDVKCGQRSSMNSAAVLTFPEASNLTCPITLTATPGFLLSTSKNDNSKYGQSVTVKPIKSEPNKGKITQKVYVRAEAAAGLSGPMSGTITVTGSEITETTINLNAEVMCTQYTLTVVDHLGNSIATSQHYEGNEVAKIAQPTPDDCSTNYTFDGWSTTEVEYGSLVYNKVSFPFSMPAEDVTLYPVYICSEDYHRVTYDLGADNWEGEYLIAASNTAFANGYQGGTTDANCIGGTNSVRDLSKYITNDVVSKECYTCSVKLIAVSGGYVLQTRDGKYNYITANATSGLTANENLLTADDHPLTIVFNSITDIAITDSANVNKASLQYTATYFRFYKPGNQKPVYLYKKYLYTTPLICGSIEAENTVVTSTAEQTIKVNVPITITSTLGGKTNITAESDNEHFTVTPLENVAGKQTIAVHYTPDVTTDGTEIANITLTASHGNRATTTFQVIGRHLPENFVIAAKWGDNWYALPANMTSESITEGVLIEVDNAAAPTKALAAPNTTKYGLKSVYTSNGSADRYANNGERLVFVENVDEATPVTNKTLYNGGGDAQNSNKTSIQVYAQYKTATSGYYETNPDRYEWIPTTTDLMDYTLTSAHAFASEAARTISLDKHGIFGTLLQDKSYSGMVRLLPVDNFYAPVELQVVEWKANSVSIMYTGAGTKVTTKVGGNAESSVQVLSDVKIDHAVYNLSTGNLTTATNQALIIAIKDDANNTIGTTTLTIPWIVSGEDAMASKFSVVSDATDIVILKGATLTAEATKYTYNNVTIYGGGKLAIPTGTGLGMNTLTMRVGAVENDTYVYAYPELVLNGEYSNTSAQINLDYLTTQDYYYPLSVPEQVTIADIKYPVDIYGSNVTPTNTGSFQLKYYDGAQRVAQGSQYGTGWVVVDESTTTTLTPNQGYAIWGIPKKVSVNGAKSERQRYGIHRIPMKIAAGTLMTNEKTNETIIITAHGDASTPPNDRGWNYLGNPYLVGLGSMDHTDNDLQMGLLVQEMVNGQWTGGWINNGEQVRYVTLTNDCQNFEALPVAETTIPAFTTFFIQAAQDGAIALSAPATIIPSSVAARRYADLQEATQEITTGILLTGNNQTDRTGLLIADNFTEEYDFNADLSKFENSGINLYTIGKDGKLAYMAINQTLAELPIPVGYTATADGEYTIAFDEDRYSANDISALYLIDYDLSEKTNLLHTDYSFLTAAGTYNQRFALQVAFAPENATSIEWVEGAIIQVGVEGNTLLLNNLPTDAAVHVFDALGRLMYHAPSAQTEIQITLPTGYYLVRVADKQHSAVINTVIP